MEKRGYGDQSTPALRVCRSHRVGGLRGRPDVEIDRLDQSAANTNIALPTQRLAWIKHVTAFDHKITFIVRTHRGISPIYGSRHCKRRSGTKKITA
jgi:hypothetical protein